MDNIKLFTGRSNPELVKGIEYYLNERYGNGNFQIGKIKVGKFSNTETEVEIIDDVRGKDVFIVQTGAEPVNDYLVELLVMMNACHLNSAKRITAVTPCYPYARQDRKRKGREPISAKLVADLIQVAGGVMGGTKVRGLACDFHANQIQGFFNVQVDNLFARAVLLDWIINNYIRENLMIVSPDAGGVERARAFAKRLNVGLAVIDKRKNEEKEIEEMKIIGEVEGKNIIIVDDMVDTAGTLVKAEKALLDAGALSVNGCCTHPVLSGPAMERIENSSLEKLIVTNTIPLKPEAKQSKKIEELNMSRQLGEAIWRIHHDTSISALFDHKV